jgi:ParB family chromosome partitioning protein
LKEIYEALHPETRQGGDRGNQHTGGRQSDNLSFSQDTASKTGQNRRTVERDASRGERVSEDALDVIRGTSADKGVVLDRLAAAPKDEQVEMARQIIASRSKPVPLPKNEMETEEDWRGDVSSAYQEVAQKPLTF